MSKMEAPQNANLETLDDDAQGKKYFKGKNVVTKEDGIIYDTVEREKQIEWRVEYHSQGRKKQRVHWIPYLEQKFKDAVNKLDGEAVPSKIMKLMNVEGLERHHVASHLQKYRIRQKKEPNHNPSHKPEAYCPRLSPNVPKSVLPEQQGPVMMQPSCNMLNLSPNPPMQMPPFSPFPSQFSLSIAATHCFTIEHVQACLDNLQSSSNIQPELSLGTTSTGMTAHLNEDKEETTSLYDMLDTIPNTTGENVKSSEVIEQAPQFSIESNACFNGQMDTGLITEASNSGILTENDILMEDNFLIQDFDVSDFDITYDDLPSFEMLMSTNQFQSLDNNGQQQTDVQNVASNSKSPEDDAFTEELEKHLACDMEFDKMNDQPPPTNES